MLGDRLELGSEAARHARVLRLAAGDPVQLFDGRGGRCTARVLSVAQGKIHFEIIDVPRWRPRSAKLVLVQCLPRQGKLEPVVRMTTELGLGSLRLAVSERSVSRPDAARAGRRVERLAQVASEAARQSERDWVPDVQPPAPLLEVAALAPPGAARVALWARCAHGFELSLPESAGHGEASSVPEVWLVVGPEGGLSPAELEGLDALGYRRAGLGEGILRTETAAVVAVALANAQFGTPGTPDGAPVRPGATAENSPAACGD